MSRKSGWLKPDPRKEALESIRRFESGETDFEEHIDARGVRNLMIRDPEDPRRYRIESETPDHELKVTITGLRLPASEARPSELPSEYPFIPGSATVLIRMAASGSTAVRWEGPEDPQAVFRTVSDQLGQDGWTETGSSEGSGPGPRHTIFERGGASRRLVLFSGPHRTDVVLMEDKAGF
jgi:hypothetical protein